MVNKVSWTDQALEDLDAVCLVIARDVPPDMQKYLLTEYLG